MIREIVPLPDPRFALNHPRAMPAPLSVSLEKKPAAFAAFPSVFLVLCLSYYLIFFVLSAAFQHDALWVAPGPHQPYGYVGGPLGAGVLDLAGAGIGALILGYFLGIGAARAGRTRWSRFWPGRASRPETGRPADINVLFALCVVAIVAEIALLLSQIRVPIVYQLVNGALFFLIAVVRYGQIAKSASPTWRAAGYAALLILCVVLASARQWTNLFMFIIFLALIEVLHRRYRWLAWVPILALAIILYPMQRTALPPEIAAICAKTDVPPQGRYGFDVFGECVSSVERFGLLAAMLPWARNHVLRRISAIRLLDRAVRETPGRVPFFAGETLRPLLFVAIPRVLWPDKPHENIGNRIGHAYRILNPDDRSTSINLPWIVEFYINFGVKGVILGLGLVGIALGGLAWLGTAESESASLALLTVGVLFPLAYQESNISLMIGNALHGAAGAGGLIVLAWIAIRYSRKPTGLPPAP